MQCDPIFCSNIPGDILHSYWKATTQQDLLKASLKPVSLHSNRMTDYRPSFFGKGSKILEAPVTVFQNIYINNNGSSNRSCCCCCCYHDDDK